MKRNKMSKESEIKSLIKRIENLENIIKEKPKGLEINKKYCEVCKTETMQQERLFKYRENDAFCSRCDCIKLVRLY
jgi:ribosomal protein S15P/S13E